MRQPQPGEEGPPGSKRTVPDCGLMSRELRREERERIYTGGKGRPLGGDFLYRNPKRGKDAAVGRVRGTALHAQGVVFLGQSITHGVSYSVGF